MSVIRKTVAASGDGLEFVLSDATVDRYGDVIEPAGWDLRWFKQNPIALFGHDNAFPIGRWENIRVEGGKLVAKLAFAAEGTSARIDEMRKLVEQGILRAVSVGFKPVEYEALDPKRPGRGQRYKKQELLETSLVSVPANPAALAVAKSLQISDDTLSVAFGEHATGGDGILRRGVAGEQADLTTAPLDKARVAVPARPKAPNMTTLSQRIENAESQLVQKKDKLVELTNSEAPDVEAIEELTNQIDAEQRGVAALKAAEAKIGISALPGGGFAAPAVLRRPLGFPQVEVKASDLIVRSAVCHLLAHITKQPVERIVEERYPGHEATAVVTKADIAVATTTTSGWASQLVQTAMAEFLSLLPPTSLYPALRSMGIGLTFGPNSGAIKIPFSSSTDALAGGFVLEGDPIPVGRMTLDSTTLTPHKFGIIVPMTKEVMRYTNPALEAVVRSELLNRTSIRLDTLLIDTTAGSTTRPAGLRYGVSAAGSAYGGDDYKAFLEDMKTLLSPFDTANAGRSLALLMNPAQARSIRMLAGPNSSGFGWANQFLADFRVIVSTTVTAGTIIAIDTADFVTGTGDTPLFETSDQATIHMSDTPLEIVSGTPTTADPVRSMFQTNSVALKMTMDVTWAMRRTGMVQWISGVNW
jgi:HK97 family phage prohead protease